MVDQGHAPPQQYFDRPEIESHLHPLWQAFIELSTERQIGMGIGPIPVSKIKEYVAAEFDLGCDDAEQCLQILRCVDDEFLTLNNPGNRGTNLRHEVTPDDAAGVSRLFESLEAGQDKKRRKSTAPAPQKKDQ